MTFGDKRGQDKLYKQWVSHGDITPTTKETKIKSRRVRGKNEAHRSLKEDNEIPTKLIKEAHTDTNQGKKIRNSPNFLYILLTVSIALVCVGLVLIFKIL